MIMTAVRVGGYAVMMLRMVVVVVVSGYGGELNFSRQDVSG
jgi:hypothetical protein